MVVFEIFSVIFKNLTASIYLCLDHGFSWQLMCETSVTQLEIGSVYRSCNKGSVVE